MSNEMCSNLNEQIIHLGYEAGLAKRFLDNFVTESRNKFINELLESKPEEKEYRDRIYLFLKFLKSFEVFLTSYISGASGNILLDTFEQTLKEENGE